MYLASQIIILSLSLAGACKGYSTFETTCTTPSTTVNFVSSPNSRGTLDILWSCLFTIVACTWTIQHLNVPEQRKAKDRDHGRWCDLKWALKSFWMNLKWMLITMVAPEFILGKALGELLAAWHWRERMREYAEQDGVQWGLAHGFYSNMGGFVGASEGVASSADDTPLDAHDIYWLRHTPREVAIQAAVEGEDPELQSKEPRTKLEKLPDITFAEIYDKSKGNVFVKTIAIVQVFWVVLQIVVRGRKGLSISQLELAAAAFSACAIITYALLIPKPQGVQVPSRIVRCEPGSIEAANNENTRGELRMLFIPDFLRDYDKEHKRIPNDTMYTGIDQQGTVYINYATFLGFILGGIVFGSIHVVGWNLSFPTAIEQRLWRISSILLTTLMPALFLPTLSTMHSDIVTNFIEDYPLILQTWDVLLSALYIAARLFILVEIFRTLLYLPPDAYVSTWAASMPHVA